MTMGQISTRQIINLIQDIYQIDPRHVSVLLFPLTHEFCRQGVVINPCVALVSYVCWTYNLLVNSVVGEKMKMERVFGKL